MNHHDVCSVIGDEKLSVVIWVEDGAGDVEGRHEVVVEVVVAAQIHQHQRFGQVPPQLFLSHLVLELAQCGPEILHLLAQRESFSLSRTHREQPFHFINFRSIHIKE